MQDRREGQSPSPTDGYEGFGVPRLRRGGADSHASDIGHWLGMTDNLRVRRF